MSGAVIGSAAKISWDTDVVGDEVFEVGGDSGSGSFAVRRAET